VTITASNGVGADATQVLTLTVKEPPAFTSVSGTTFTAGQFGTFAITTAGFPVATLSLSGPLPAGVKFVRGPNGTATLRGTPTSPGTYRFKITAKSVSLPAVVQWFTLTVV
jgi:hypothetical protein